MKYIFCVFLFIILTNNFHWSRELTNHKVLFYSIEKSFYLYKNKLKAENYFTVFEIVWYYFFLQYQEVDCNSS
jgi:hypothetical protein